MLAEITTGGKFPAIVIDEANLCIPDGDEGRGGSEEGACPQAAQVSPWGEEGSHRHFVAQFPELLESPWSPA